MLGLLFRLVGGTGWFMRECVRNFNILVFKRKERTSRPLEGNNIFLQTVNKSSIFLVSCFLLKLYVELIFLTFFFLF